jgi:endoglucanase
MDTPELLQNLLSTPGPSGYEAPAAAVWRDAASFAEVEVDGIGSSNATIGDVDAEPRLAVVGLIDEFGVAISHVDDNGFLFFVPIGGWDPQVLVGQRVRLETREGPVLGVIGRKAIHLLKDEQRKVAVELDGLHVDIGAGDRDRAMELVRIGDSGVIAVEPVRLEGERLISRSMDDRLGAYVALESLRRVHERGELAGRMTAIASVQEEVGLKGATTSAFAVGPDLAIAIDVTHANDTPGSDEKQGGRHKLGSGPVIGRGSTLSPKVFELLAETAERLGIDHTIEASGRYTGTDADAIQISKAGIPTGLISIPLRYMHSPVEMVDLADVEGAVELVAGFAASLTADVDLSR